MKIKKKEHSGRSRFSEERIYGLNPVFEALRSGRKIKSLFLSSSRRDKIQNIEEEAGKRGLKINRVDEAFFDVRFPKGHQGIAAMLEPRQYWDIDTFLDIPNQKKQPALFLVLDGVEDPRNFGAILRVADAAGVHGVVIQSHRSASLTPEAIKASAGASEHIPITMVPNIKHALRDMSDAGIAIVCAEAGGEKTIWDIDMKRPVALVLGSEGEGIRRTVKEYCEAVINIPMGGKVNSLNVSVASGIILYEIFRQRTRNI